MLLGFRDGEFSDAPHRLAPLAEAMHAWVERGTLWYRARPRHGLNPTNTRVNSPVRNCPVPNSWVLSSRLPLSPGSVNGSNRKWENVSCDDYENPDAKRRLIGKDLDAGKGWSQEEKRATEDGWMASMDMSLSRPQEIVKDREAWRPAVHGLAKSRIRPFATEWQQGRPPTDPLFATDPLCYCHLRSPGQTYDSLIIQAWLATLISPFRSKV